MFTYDPIDVAFVGSLYFVAFVATVAGLAYVVNVLNGSK